MNKRTCFSYAIAATALLLPACATVTRGSHVEFNVATEPAGAVVTTTLQTSETREAERRREDFIRLGFYNEDELDPVVPEYRGCKETPCSFQVLRKSDFVTTVSMPGYHSATVEITSGFGQKGAKTTAGGTAASVAGGYIVTHAVVTTMATGLFTLTSALTGTAVSSSAVGSTAASAASTAATGIGVTMIGVDLLSGAMLDVSPNPLMLVLVPETEPAPDSESVLIDTPEKYEALVAKYSATN